MYTMGDEFSEIITNGEFSRSLSIIYNSEVLPIRGTVEEGWKRSEVDGVLTVDIPRETKTVLIAQSALPLYIPESEYYSLRFLIDNVIYSPTYVIGKTTRAFLISIEDNLDNGVNDDTTGDDEIDTSAPGVVV